MRFAPLESYREANDGDDWAPAWERAMVADESQVSLPKGTLRFRSPMRFRRNVEAMGCGVFHTSLVFTGTPAGVVLGAYGADPVWRGDDARLSRMTIRYDAAGQQPPADCDGIRVEAPIVHLYDLLVTYWPRDGIHVTGGVTRVPPSNANLGLHMLVRTGGNGRHGIYFSGGDANAHSLVMCDSSGSKGDGIRDESFLGNTMLGCHTATNTGASYVAEGYSQRTTLLGCYAEGDQAPARVTRGNLAVNVRAVADPSVQSPRIDGSSGGVTVSRSTIGDGKVRAQLGSTDPESAMDIFAPSAPSDAYRLVARAAGGLKDMWSWTWKGASSLAAFAMTTAQHPRGPGFPVSPRGMLLGLGPGQRMVDAALVDAIEARLAALEAKP